MTTPPGGRLTYAYAVLRSGSLPDAELCGVGEAPVDTVTEGPLAALVSTVPAAEFGQAEVHERLEDLRWLEATARAHRRVVDEAADAVCVLPLRLITVYRDEDAVRGALAEHAARFERLLAELDGRLEWGVKAYTQAPEDRPEPYGPPTSSAGSGRDFLRRRLRDRQVREVALQEADGLARTVHQTLEDAAERSHLHRPQDARLAEAVGSTDGADGGAVPRGRNVLNGAYLVPRERASAFAETVAELAARSPALRLELTGPWAPYSFTELPEDTDRSTP